MITITDNAYKFNAGKEAENVVRWIKNWFENESGGASGAILGISGGADSTVVAKLCREAIGRDKVRGVLMPNGNQPDIADSYRVCGLLGIKYDEINIGGAFDDIIKSIPEKLSGISLINIAPRLRMTVIYALGQTLNYRVAGTGNLSERYVGYCTKWGIDMASDFNPVVNFTKTEVKQIGDYLGLPRDLVHKTPADGLSGLSDEENMGISYDILDNYIRTGLCEEKDAGMIERITARNAAAQHKLNPIPGYLPAVF
jgi:NAD+ synthase